MGWVQELTFRGDVLQVQRPTKTKTIRISSRHYAERIWPQCANASVAELNLQCHEFFSRRFAVLREKNSRSSLSLEARKGQYWYLSSGGCSDPLVCNSSAWTKETYMITWSELPYKITPERKKQNGHHLQFVNACVEYVALQTLPGKRRKRDTDWF